ncbi:MAG: RNA 2',3'-cyclic phosphodiesterase [Nannocystaceae bacterium]|nr:RNA 2',3'-cyclic phosphodiesterase [Nannocystaceae bacterium]
MARLFLGLDLPDVVDEHLSLLCGGVPGARWEPRENLHLTLRFLGELEGETQRRAIEALETVHAEPFVLELAGVGVFPPRGEPRVLWAGVADAGPVTELVRRIERALQRAGLPPEPRKFAAHVTLARLRDAPRERVAAFLAHHGLLRTASFEVDAFLLYSSVLGHAGAHYRVERSVALRRSG